MGDKYGLIGAYWVLGEVDGCDGMKGEMERGRGDNCDGRKKSWNRDWNEV